MINRDRPLIGAVREMAKAGMDVPTIRAALCARFHSGSVSRAIERVRAQGGLPSKQRKNAAMERTQALESDRGRRASIMHLVDLKRAGHSPTRTELHIPSDGDVSHPMLRAARYRNVLGSHGSPGAMCADQSW